MGYRLEWSTRAQKDLEQVDLVVARRILKKLKWMFEQKDPLVFARQLEHPTIGDARFRIGDYRVIVTVDKKKQIIVVATVGHRRDIYH